VTVSELACVFFGHACVNVCVCVCLCVNGFVRVGLCFCMGMRVCVRVSILLLCGVYVPQMQSNRSAGWGLPSCAAYAMCL